MPIIDPSLNLLALLLALDFCLSSFSVALSTLKSHRVLERLQSLSGLFFYLQIHQKVFGKDLSHLKTCLSLARTLTHYGFVTCTVLFLLAAPSFHSIGTQANLKSASQIAIIFAIALISLLLTDTLPRYFATRWPQFFLKTTSLPSSILCSLSIGIAYPLIKVLEKRDLPEEDPVQDTTFEVREKMMEILHDFDSTHLVDWQNRALLNGIIKYQDRVVREVMVPRVEIFCLPASTSINDAASQILREGFTRVPVYEDNIDNILGVIMAKDLLKSYLEAQNNPDAHMTREVTISHLVKPVLYTPENKRVSILLQDFRKHHLHLAIVVDEYGGTEGLVTIEDILEEIVGDIEDEYDLGEKPFTLLSDGTYLVDAHMSILDLNENLGSHIPTNGEYDTLSGYIFSKIGSIPAKGLVIHQNAFELEVIDCNERSVETVRMRILPPNP